MADLSKELDLNVPAAPSLTLDATPSLTLDPTAEEKAVEEAKQAEPVKVEDTPLSPEEQKMVDDFAEKIDITNSQMVLQYGAASQKKLSFPGQDQRHGGDRGPDHRADRGAARL